MNKLTLFAITILVCGACTHNKNLYDEKNFEKIIANCETSQDFTVPVKEGYATYVTCGEDTLAATTKPITIKIPKQHDVLTKADANLPISIDFGIVKSDFTYSKYWQAVMFEDTQDGDYDYNDLILHIENKMDNMRSNQKISIQPIALGSEKVIKLGCVLCDGSVHIISEDVRQDLFNGQKGFINTVNDFKVTPFKKLVPYVNVTFDFDTPSFTISWFIEVEGQRFFAISADNQYANYADMFNTDGMPYGLVVYEGENGKANGTFAYPQEKVSIFKAYPDAKAWMSGKKNNIGAGIKEHIYKYCYYTDGINIWNYER